MEIAQLNMLLLVGAGVLLVAIGAVRLTARAGLPTLLVYLALGLALGESGAGIRFDDAQLAQDLGLTALVVILIEGGLTTRWSSVRPGLPAAVMLATVGVAISAGLTAVAAATLLDLDWRLALLCGAVLSPTDAAAVFSTLRRLRLPPRLTAILEAESGLNDAPVVLAVVLLSTHSHGAPWEIAALLVYELAAGAVIGLVIGRIGAEVLRRQALPATGLYPVAAMAFALLGYATASVAHASGFLAVYLASLVLGNTDLPHRPAVRSFSEGLAWLAQIGMFVMLGLLASPSRLPGAILPGIAVGLALLLVARPVSVALSVLPLRLSWREQGFLSWAGLRGAVPIVLATIPLTEGVRHSTRLFDLVFVLVIVFTLVQGPTLPFVARRLGVSAPAELHDLDVEIAPLERLDSDLLQLTVPQRSRLHAVELYELRLPPGAAVLLVVRDGHAVVPDQTSPVFSGDDLLIVTPSRHRELVERRLRLVHEAGRTARGWWGDPRNATPSPPASGVRARVAGWWRRGR